MSNWLEFPIVSAPGALGRSETVYYEISEEYVATNARLRRRTPIFHLWAHVVGRLPPINNAHVILADPAVPTISTLHDSVACFQGVKRPLDTDDDGNLMRAYILNPKVSIEYDPGLACVARAVQIPERIVAMVLVKPTFPLQKHGKSVTDQVIRIEFVLRDEREPTLPKGARNRFSEQLW